MEAPTLRPLRDLVYVRQDPLPEKASGSALFIPDSTKKHVFTRFGTVLAVGPGKLVCWEEEDRKLAAACPRCSADHAFWWHSHDDVSCRLCGWKGFDIDRIRPEFIAADNIDGKVWITCRLPMPVRVGDRVMFADFWGTCIGLETDPSLLIGPASGEEGLLAVMEVDDAA